MTEARDETIEFGDIRFTSDQNDVGGRAYKDRGWYEEYRNPIYSSIRAAISPSWVIDVGANYGLTVLFAQMRFPEARIIAAEPVPRLADYIRRNAATNGLDKFTLFEGFVGQTVGESFPFHVLDNSTQDSRVMSPGAKWSETAVAQTTLDRLTSDVPDAAGVYIKIDTQGYEENVFRGGEQFLQRNRNWILKTEFAPNWLRSQGTQPAELLEYLIERYVVCEAMPRSLFNLNSLRDATSKPLAREDIGAFLDHVVNLNRRGLGWVDLLILPRALHHKLAHRKSRAGLLELLMRR